MEIKELDLVLQLICQYVEFFQSQTMLGPIRFGTELAIKVTYIRYFKVASGYHKYRLSVTKKGLRYEVLLYW